MITDVAVAQPYTLPNIILDKVPGVDLDQNLVDAGVGVMDIRSVYDIDGVDTANPNIATVADSAKTPRERAPGALPAPGEGGIDPRQDGREPVAGRLRRDQLHAGDPGLRAHRAGRLGAVRSAGQRRLPHGSPGCQRAAHLLRAARLAAGKAGRDRDLQRLPPPGDRAERRFRTAARDCSTPPGRERPPPGSPFPGTLAPRARVRSCPTRGRPWPRRACASVAPPTRRHVSRWCRA